MRETKRTVQQGEKSIYVEQGEVHITYAGERRIPRALTPPPFQPEVFLGRGADLQRIHDRLFAPGGNLLLLVNGEGGVGKTTLASKYFHTYQAEYAHLAWVLSEKSIANALLLLAPPLGLQFDERMGEAQRLEGLLAALLELQKPCLLVLDNANELPDLEAHYQRLRRCSNFHLLLTTRITSFEHAETCPIAGLPEAESLELFERYYRALDAEERALFFRIREAVGANTLVLELLAKNLAGQNRLRQRYTLADLLADLQGRGLLQLSHTQAVGTDYQSRGALRRETPEAIIGAMYELGGLPPEETALLSVFAALPAEAIPLARLEALLGGGEAHDEALLALAQKGWIEYNEAEVAFKCSPVVQEVTRLKNPAWRSDCRPVLNILIWELDRDKLHEDNYRHSAVYTRYAEALALVWKQPDDDVATLCQNIGDFHTDTGNLDKAMNAYQQMADIFAALHAADPADPGLKNGLAISYSKLGDTHTALGHLEQALTFFEDETALFEELYAVYPQNVSFKNGLAISYEKLGSTHTVLGHLEQALTFFEERSRLGKELYAAYPQNVSFKNGLAISYSKLGSTHTALGHLEQALTFFEERSQLAKELYAAYPQNVSFKNGLAISYEKLGSTHTALGHLEQALTFFEKDIELSKELYAAYPQNVSFKNGLAISYSKLGEFYRDQKGDRATAKGYFQQCYALLQELTEAYPAYVEFRNNFEWVKAALAGWDAK